MLYSKSKLELASNLSEFCQLIASSSMVHTLLNLTKLKFEYLKSSLKYKKERYEKAKKILHHSSSTF